MRIRRLVTVLVLAGALVAPSAALAQSDPFSPLPPADESTQAPTPAVTATPTTDTGGGGLKGWQEALIFVAGGVLIVGIGWAIVRDARKAAPVEEGEIIGGAGGQGSHKQVTKARARKKGKAAKQARRHNR
jgi:predicted cobalt transporter CbtA